MGASVGLPAASLCINRRLYLIASVQTVTVTRAEVGYTLPCLGWYYSLYHSHSETSYCHNRQPHLCALPDHLHRPTSVLYLTFILSKP